MSSTCIACLESKHTNNLKKLDEKNNYSQFEDIYELLIYCIPQIKPVVTKTHWMCFPCLFQLCECVGFIQKCIQSAERVTDVEKIKVEEICLPNEPLNDPIAIKEEETGIIDSGSLSEVEENSASDLEDVSGIDLSDFSDISLPEPVKNKSSKKKNFNKSESVIHKCDSDCKDGMCTSCTADLCKLLTHTCTIVQFNCTKCNNIFPSYEALETHTKDCSNAKLPKTKKARTSRRKKPTQSIIHSCDIECSEETCSICDTYKCKLTLHTCKFVCSKCSTNFDSKDKLETHLKDNVDEEECRIGCEHCPLVLPASEIEAHQKIHPTFGCHICGKLFFHRTSLTSHRLVHLEKKNKCPVCPATFKTSTAMMQHHRYSHQDAKIMLCDQCPRKFVTTSRLRKHKSQFHDHVVQSLCSICGMSFRSTLYAEKHARLVHQNLKPYCCQFCGKTFGRKDYIERHTKICNESSVLRARAKGISPRNLHKKKYFHFNGWKPVECLYCKKIFKSVTNLFLHIKSTHVKLQLPRPFKCEVCPLRFRAKAVLQRHEAKHKNTDTKFRCDICYKKFKNVEEVDKHLSEKHKKKAYACNLCDEKFSRKFILDNHREAVHNPDQVFDTSVDDMIKAAIEHLEKVGNAIVADVDDTEDIEKDSEAKE